MRTRDFIRLIVKGYKTTKTIPQTGSINGSGVCPLGMYCILNNKKTNKINELYNFCNAQLGENFCNGVIYGFDATDGRGNNKNKDTIRGYKAGKTIHELVLKEIYE